MAQDQESEDAADDCFFGAPCRAKPRARRRNEDALLVGLTRREYITGALLVALVGLCIKLAFGLSAYDQKLSDVASQVRELRMMVCNVADVRLHNQTLCRNALLAAGGRVDTAQYAGSLFAEVAPR